MRLLDELVIDVLGLKYVATSFNLVVDVADNPWIVHIIDSIRIKQMERTTKDGRAKSVSTEMECNYLHPRIQT
jgi:hypothetical protein